MKKLIITIISIVSLSTALLPLANTVVYADEFAAESSISYTDDISILSDSNGLLPDNSISPRFAIGGIAVFVAGILAGYVIDGVLIYTTNVSGGEWVAKAIKFVAQNPKVGSVNFTSPHSQPFGGRSGGGAF